MKLFELIEDKKHKLLADLVDDGTLEQLEVHLVNLDTKEDLGEINTFIESIKDRMHLLDNGKGGIRILTDSEDINVGLITTDDQGVVHTIIPEGANIELAAKEVSKKKTKVEEVKEEARVEEPVKEVKEEEPAEEVAASEEVKEEE